MRDYCFANGADCVFKVVDNEPRGYLNLRPIKPFILRHIQNLYFVFKTEFVIKPPLLYFSLKLKKNTFLFVIFKVSMEFSYVFKHLERCCVFVHVVGFLDVYELLKLYIYQFDKFWNEADYLLIWHRFEVYFDAIKCFVFVKNWFPKVKHELF